MNDNKFTPRAEEALRLSQEAAGELGHGYVGTEHLLLGLLREEDGSAHTILCNQGLTDEAVTEVLRRSVGVGLPGGNPAQGLTPRARRVIELAVEDSIRSGSPFAGTEHLLVGILRDGSNMAVRILRAVDCEPRRLYAALMQTMHQRPQSVGADTEHRGGTPSKDDTKLKTLREFSRDLTAAARSGRAGDPAGSADSLPPDKKQSLSDWRAGSRQNRHCGGVGTEDRSGRCSGGAAGQAYPVSGPVRHGGRHQIPGRI